MEHGAARPARVVAATRDCAAACADTLFAECRDLHPDSWNIFRETSEKMDTGIAAGEAFWGKVMSLGDKQYYASIGMEGMPE